MYNPWQAQTRRNRIKRAANLSFLECSVEGAGRAQQPPRPDILFEDWNQEDFDGWTADGTAFGKGPVKKSEMPGYQGDVGCPGDRVVNTHAAAPESSMETRDACTGKIRSREFRIERNFINAWIGGGAHPGQTSLDVVVDGKVAHSLVGNNQNPMSEKSIDVRALQGRQAVIEIVDSATGAWGNIGVGQIRFSGASSRATRLLLRIRCNMIKPAG